MNKLMKSFCIGILALSVSFLLLVNSSSAQSITLTLGSGQGKPGETVSLSLNLSDSNSAASFQLTIEYDASVLENPTAVRGSSLISADKNLYNNTPSDGKLKLVAVGVNNNTIPSGQVATINFSIKSDAPLGTTQLVLDELVASDADGNNLTITGNGGAIEGVSRLKVYLLYPPNGYISALKNVTFVCSANSSISTIMNISLYTNISGWTVAYTNETGGYINHTINNISNGSYIWNCYACNNEGECVWGNNNYTLIIDMTPPVIRNVQSTVSHNSATIVWDTDKISNSTVLYGTGSLNLIESDSDLVINHNIHLMNLESGTFYYFKVISCNVNGCNSSEIYNFTTETTSTNGDSGNGGNDGGGGNGGSGGGSGGSDRQNCTDNDNDGYAKGGDWCGLLDCDDSDPNVHPGATEVCNGKDDNCDGIIDNIKGRHGIEETNCQCYNGNKPKQEECNGIDDDCNGEIDDNANCCIDGQERECGPSSTLGVCKRGVSICTKGKWSECSGAVFPGKEICGNGKDDDCDGETDENCNTCSNGIQDGDEEGIDCGGSCPNPCFDWSYLIISLIGSVILVVVLCFYFKLRKQKELMWEELMKKYQR